MGNDLETRAMTPAPAPGGERAQIIIVYALFGPLAGFLVLMLGKFISNLVMGTMGPLPSEVWRAVFGFLVLGSFATYVTGGLQALATGLLLFAVADRNGCFAYWQAALVAALVGAIAAPVIVLGFGSRIEAAAMLAALGVISSLVLRFLWRNEFGRKKFDA